MSTTKRALASLATAAWLFAIPGHAAALVAPSPAKAAAPDAAAPKPAKTTASKPTAPDSAAPKAAEPEEDVDDEPSFTEITLDVKH